VAALRRAFDAMTSDAEFVREAERAHVTLNYVRGGEVAALVDEIHRAPRSIIERASKTLRAIDP
jgi:hypothetical protein